MSPRIVVIDTNVLVSGLITLQPLAPTHEIVAGMTSGRFSFLLSTALLAEYWRVLQRPRIRKRHNLSANEVESILSEIAANAIVRHPDRSEERAPDPDDQHLWDLVFSEDNSALVTGDARLLKAGRRITVLSPATFVKLLPA